MGTSVRARKINLTFDNYSLSLFSSPPPPTPISLPQDSLQYRLGKNMVLGGMSVH